MIKVVLFDVDGVVANAFMAFSQVLASEYLLPLTTTADFFTGPFNECLAGKKDIRKVLPAYLKKWQWSGSLDDFLHLWFTSEHSLEHELIEDADRLRARGIQCYLTTNQEKYRASYLMEDMGLAEHFDGLFASFSLGVCKPERDFFVRILAKLHIMPEEVLFWDDMPVNVIAARGYGLYAEQYKGLEAYKTKMEDRYHL